MKQTTAPAVTPSPRPSQTKSQTGVDRKNSPNKVFVAMALDMSWQLAIVVLVPIVGGFELDQHFHATPLLTLIGFVLAMVGMALVLKRMLQVVSQLPPQSKERRS